MDPSNLTIRSISVEIPEAPGTRLHVRRFHSGTEHASGPPVLMVHGAIEDGRIFYSSSGKGFAPFLASRGYDVFVADLRGRGQSTPKIGRSSSYGQTESITEDLTALYYKVRSLRGDVRQHWIAHSWGGVLMLSHLARFPERADHLHSLVLFGTKRSIHVFNLQKLLMIDLFWNRGASLLTRAFGYLPARELRVGADNETAASLRESQAWVRPSKWVDPRDGFDYGSAIRKVHLPPALFLAGQSDACLGHPSDVQRLVDETANRRAEVRLLSRASGNRHDYGHIDMLTHPDAADDHFPWVADWMKRKDHHG